MDYTIEMKEVLNYMSDILITEFPTDKLTIEYMVVALLDKKKCHAFMILDNKLTSTSINSLHDFYLEIIKNNNKNPSIIDKNAKFDDNLIDLIEKGKNEAEKLENKLIGSEHILLALLDENNSNPIKRTFNTIGLDYNFIYNACAENTNEKKQAKTKLPTNKMDNPFMIITSSSISNKALINPKGEITSSSSPSIDAYTININKLVEKGDYDKVIGREKEIKQIIKTLARRKKNNVILLGEPGVGKTSLPYKIAELINNNKVPDIIKNKTIVMLDVLALISGTTFRGMLEQRVKSLFDELTSSKNYILLLDDMQQILKTGSKDKDTDLSEMLGNILNNGEVRVIGTIGFKDYKNGIEGNVNLSRKFQKIIIEPNTKNETLTILNNIKIYYENYHNVRYSDEILNYAIDLANRYVTERKLPDSAIDILDVAGASTCLVNRKPQDILDIDKQINGVDKKIEEALECGNFEAIDALNIEKDKYKIELNELTNNFKKNTKNYIINITEDDIAKTVSEMVNIPVNKLSTNEKEKMIHLEDKLRESIIGQNDAIETICRSIKRNRVGLSDANKPITVSLLCGPSGVGKTLLAKKIAGEVFGDERNLIRIDMSEFSEKSSVAKLIGASAGYIGYGDINMLTDKVKNKPYSVILLDEIEKANEEIFNLLLQVFDDGRLTDGKGNTVSFKQCIILMTSNIGAKDVSSFSKGMGFVADEGKNKKSIFEKALKNKFNPEFINRIDSILYFNSLTDDNLKNIIKLELSYLNDRLLNNNFKIKYDDNTINFILQEIAKDKEFGARPIKRFIANNIEDKIVDKLLETDYKNGYEFNLSIIDDNLNIA